MLVLVLVLDCSSLSISFVPIDDSDERGFWRDPRRETTSRQTEFFDIDPIKGCVDEHEYEYEHDPFRVRFRGAAAN